MAGKATHTQPHSKTGRVENHPGMQDQTLNSRDLEHFGHKLAQAGNVALDPGPNSNKHNSQAAVTIHGGMSRQQTTMAGVGGMGHATSIKEIPDASSGNPLDKEPPSKVFSAPAPAWGQRSRTNADIGRNALNHDLGAAILNEATKSGSTDLKR